MTKRSLTTEYFTSQGKKYLLRSFAPNDAAGIRALWKVAFFKDFPAAWWQWKYLNNPYGHQMVLCCTEDDQIVGVYSGIPYRAWWQNKVVRLTQLMDIMVHPDYRKDGLFLHLAKTFFDWYAPPSGSVCLYGFPGTLHFRIGSRLLRYKALSRRPAYLTAETASLASKRRLFLGKLEPVAKVDFSFDRLAHGWRHRLPCAVIRDADFINWRFFQHPHHDYQIWAYRPFIDQQWLGYGVFTVQGETARLVDLILPPEPVLVRDFLGRTAHHLVNDGATRLETWLPPEQAITRSLMASGMVAGEEPFGIVPTVKILHPGLQADWLASHLYYTMADTDLC